MVHEMVHFYNKNNTIRVNLQRARETQKVLPVTDSKKNIKSGKNYTKVACRAMLAHLLKDVGKGVGEVLEREGKRARILFGEEEVGVEGTKLLFCRHTHWYCLFGDATTSVTSYRVCGQKGSKKRPPFTYPTYNRQNYFTRNRYN